MHLTSLFRMYDFFREYVKKNDYILDVGSKVIEDSICYGDILEYMNLKVRYSGLDIEKGKNVHIVVDDPYNWEEIKDETFDIVISGQTLEHVEFFWLVFKEMTRVLKTGGYMCVISPKIQKTHRFPVDCWRFYPDGMKALSKWADIKFIKAHSEFVHYDKFPRRPIDCVGIFQK